MDGWVVWLGLAIILLTVGLLKPWGLIGRIIYLVMLGVLLIGIVNLVSPYLGIRLPLNVLTVVVAGLLGIPGLASLILLQLLG
jgi:inhibitor of the pro-sigma K processing machinery